jgi:hypothetical protein
VFLEKQRELPSGAWGRLWIEPPGGEILSHLLLSSFDEPRVCDDVFDHRLRSVALDVLFPKYVPKGRPLLYMMNDEFANLSLLFIFFGATEEPLPKRTIFLAHNISPSTIITAATIIHKTFAV